MTNLSKKHQQVLETKQRLSKALYLLITERHYDKITIYQILDRATISRRTFYRYFNDKADLMDFCLENFVKGYYLQRDNFIVAKKPEDVFLVTLNFMWRIVKLSAHLSHKKLHKVFSSLDIFVVCCLIYFPIPE